MGKREKPHPDDATKAANLLIQITDLQSQIRELDNKLDLYLLGGVSPSEVAKLARTSADSVSQRTTRARRRAGLPLRDNGQGRNR